MSIEIVKIKDNPTGHFSIWIDEDQGFRDKDLLSVINSLGINKTERVYSSLGPSQVIDEVHTTNGAFRLAQEFDEFAGSTIYSDNQELMSNILSLMVGSKKFKVRM
jgi:hypothetical protein